MCNESIKRRPTEQLTTRHMRVRPGQVLILDVPGQVNAIKQELLKCIKCTGGGPTAWYALMCVKQTSYWVLSAVDCYTHQTLHSYSWQVQTLHISLPLSLHHSAAAAAAAAVSGRSDTSHQWLTASTANTLILQQHLASSHYTPLDAVILTHCSARPQYHPYLLSVPFITNTHASGC